MVNSVGRFLDTADASDMIPARLGMTASIAMVIGTSGLFAIPVIQIPTWEKIVDEADPGLLLMSDVDESHLMDLDSLHNPLLAELWRHDVDDEPTVNP